MSWARFDDRYPVSRKIRRLSDAAFRLDVSAVCWANAELTDGRIARRDLRFVADIDDHEAAAAELVAAGRWEATDDGWEIHDFLEYNPSRAQVLDKREKTAAAGRAGGLTRAANRNAKQNAKQNAWQDAKQDVERTASQPANPVPTRPDPSPSSGARASQDAHEPPPEPRQGERTGEPRPPAEELNALLDAVVERRPAWRRESVEHHVMRALEDAGSWPRTAAAMLRIAATPQALWPAAIHGEGRQWRELAPGWTGTVADLIDEWRTATAEARELQLT